MEMLAKVTQGPGGSHPDVKCMTPIADFLKEVQSCNRRLPEEAGTLLGSEFKVTSLRELAKKKKGKKGFYSPW